MGFLDLGVTSDKKVENERMKMMEKNKIHMHAISDTNLFTFIL